MKSYEANWFNYEKEVTDAHTGQSEMFVPLLDSCGCSSSEDVLSAFPINYMEHGNASGSNNQPAGHIGPVEGTVHREGWDISRV